MRNLAVSAAAFLLGAAAFAGEAAPAPAPASPAELPANVWTKVTIDQKAALATSNVQGAAWMFSDGYSDSVYRSKTGNVLIRRRAAPIGMSVTDSSG